MLQYNEICRICTNRINSLTNIYDYDNDKLKYSDKLKSLFHDVDFILEENAEYCYICINCCQKLEESLNFKNQCIRSVNYWKQFIQCDEVKKENNVLYLKQEIFEECTSFTEHGNFDPETDNESVKSKIIIAARKETLKIENSNNQEEKNSKLFRKCRKRRKELKTDKFPSIIDPVTFTLDKIQNVFLCKICNKNFVSRDTLKSHMLKHVGKKKWTCRYCSEKMCTYNELKMHILTHKKTNTFTCQICAKTLKTKKALKIHSFSHMQNKPFMCDVCGKSFAVNCNLKKHMLSHSDRKLFKCATCSKEFKSISSLNSHNDKHKNRKFPCDQCEKTFQSYSGVYAHKMNVHTDVKKFQCHLCDSSFFMRNQLTQHIKKHTNDMSVTCSVCEKQFANNYILRTHMRVHTGEKPYKCNVCAKTFTQAGTLLVHTRLHTGERPYRCRFCDKGFMVSHHLTRHMKQHPT